MTLDNEDGRLHSASTLQSSLHHTPSSNDQTPRIKNNHKVNLECLFDRAMNKLVMGSNKESLDMEDGKEEGSNSRPQHFMGVPPLPGLGINPQPPPPPPAPTQTRSKGHTPPIRQNTNPNTPPRQEQQQSSSELLLLIDVSERSGDSPTPSLVAATPHRVRSSSRHNDVLDEEDNNDREEDGRIKTTPQHSPQHFISQHSSLNENNSSTPLFNNSNRKRMHLSHEGCVKLASQQIHHHTNNELQNKTCKVRQVDNVPTYNNNNDDDGYSSSSKQEEESISILTDIDDEWTLQSFMEHQLHASYLNNGTSAMNKKNEQDVVTLKEKYAKGWEKRRRLSLSSSHSYTNPVDNKDNSHVAREKIKKTESKDLKEKKSIVTSTMSSSRNSSIIPKRRRRMLFFKLLLSSLMIVFGSMGYIVLTVPYVGYTLQLSPSFLPSYVLNIKSLLLMGRRDLEVPQEGNGQLEREQGEEASESSWHPVFPHSARTANVEMLEEHLGTTQKTPLSSSTHHRRLLDESTLFTNKSNEPSPSHHFSPRQDTTLRQSQGEEEGPTFINGDVTQELCPTTHTLLSQSVILRSSYGNIFSITTPDSPSPNTRLRKSQEEEENVPSEVESTTSFTPRHDEDDGYNSIVDDWNLFTSLTKKKRGNLFSRNGSRVANKVESDTTTDSETEEADTVVEVGDATATQDGNDNNIFTKRRNLQNNNNIQIGPTGGSFSDTGDFDDIDTANESINSANKKSVETITIKTLSLRMADFRPELNTHFEVWLYTGSGDDIILNANDLDDDTTNDNLVIPSKAEYTSSRAKFNDWNLVAEGYERELVPDTDFFDNNGHVFNIGAATSIGPIGRLDKFDNMEDVTIKAREWNKNKIRSDGGMDAITAEGEVTDTFFYKIPEEKFTELKLPKYNGKLTLFVTLDRVGLQYGYAAKQEFDDVDVMKHDYIDQTPSLDVLNGNVNMRMHVGEGVIFYPWMEEEFFYQTRRFLGKIWYDAKIPCEYMPQAEIINVPSDPPTTASPTNMPSMMPSVNGTNVTAEVLISVLINDGPKPPMPVDVKEKFEDTLVDFIDDNIGDFCPLTWKEDSSVTEQETTAIGAIPGGTTSPQRRKRDVSGHASTSHRVPDYDGGAGGGGSARYLRQLLQPIFYKQNKRRSRLLQAVTLLDATTSISALYDGNECPNKTPEEFALLIEDFINDNEQDFVKELKAADDYFKDAFKVSADAILPEVISQAVEEEQDDDNLGAIIGGIIAALVLCCCCCLLPFLILRRRKRKEEKQNEIVGEDVEWARPVGDDHFPPLGGYYGDDGIAGGDGTGEGFGNSKSRKRPDGEIPEEGDSGPDLGLKPIPPGINPPEDDSNMLHDTKWLDKDQPSKNKKRRPFGMPGRMPDSDDEGDPYNINIYPGGDYEDEDGDDDDLNLRPVTKEHEEIPDSDWKPDHYEPDGGVHGYVRPEKEAPAIKPRWKRLAQKKDRDPTPQKKLSIKQMVLKRKQDLTEKMAEMRKIEKVEAGIDDSDDEDLFPKAEPDSRIEDLMSRIKDLEKDRTTKYERKGRQMGESDYEIWRRLNIGEDDLSSSDESDSDEDPELAAARRRRRKKKRRGGDYLLNFDDLDAYNRALAVHEDAYIHRWVQVKVEKGEGDEEGGANLEDIDMAADENYALNEDGIEVDRFGNPRPKIAPIRNTDDDSGNDNDEDTDQKPAAATDDAPQASEKDAGDRRSSLSRENTEYIGSVADLAKPMGPRQSASRSLKEDDEGESTPGGRMSRPLGKGMGQRQKARRSLKDVDEDEDDEAEPVDVDDIRAGLSRENTEYIGSIADLSKPMGPRQSASRSLKDVDEDEESEAVSTDVDDRRSSLSRENTEYIGSIADLSKPMGPRQSGRRSLKESMADIGEGEEDSDS